MKQVVTNKSGTLTVIDVPAPAVRPGFVVVRTRFSLISAGTEGAQVREGKAGLWTKVREHPDQVQMVLQKLRKEGIRSVASQVQDKLKEWKTLGYSCSGVVTAVGEGVDGVAVGDRVACAGAGYAVHAEQVAVPRNLVTRLPSGLDFKSAAFVTLGAIALHGVRRARPELGEQAVVIGLGLVGQLAAQFLTASGVRVAVSDLDAGRAETARKLGAEVVLGPHDDAEAAVAAWTEGRGADMVLICAATRSSAPVDLAAGLARDRARIVLVGDVGLELNRGPFYRKELDFTLSRSYGPGRYDPLYEEGGIDYPVGYVRWTEGRNFSAVLDCLSRGDVRVEPLITEEVAVDDAPAAYGRILEGGGMGTLLQYPETQAVPAPRTLELEKGTPKTGTLGVLVVGAGYFARTFHLPNLADTPNLRVAGIVSGTGANARRVAEQYQAGFCGTDFEEGLARDDVDAVLLATRHDLHVPQALTAIRAGKHVLMEKPLALDREGLAALAKALKENPVRFAVGFNRRFAPLTLELLSLVEGRQGPLHGVYRMNAGRLPKDHWVNDPTEGGGRIRGEACHVFDLFNLFAGCPPVAVQAAKLRSPDDAVIDDDNLTATVTYEDGSLLTLLYSTAGPKGFPKEQFELFAPGLAATLVDYRDLSWKGNRSGQKTLRTEDKGQAAEMKAWGRYLAGESGFVADFPSAALSTWLTLQALEAVRSGETLPVSAAFTDALGV